MRTIQISTFKATCLKLLEEVKTLRESLIITKKGVPIAIVNPPQLNPKKNAYGCMKNKTLIKGDIIAPLPSKNWKMLN